LCRLPMLKSMLPARSLHLPDGPPIFVALGLGQVRGQRINALANSTPCLCRDERADGKQAPAVLARITKI
jgi:hypothetical protein